MQYGIAARACTSKKHIPRWNQSWYGALYLKRHAWHCVHRPHAKIPLRRNTKVSTQKDRYYISACAMYITQLQVVCTVACIVRRDVLVAGACFLPLCTESVAVTWIALQRWPVVSSLATYLLSANVSTESLQLHLLNAP